MYGSKADPASAWKYSLPNRNAASPSKLHLFAIILIEKPEHISGAWTTINEYLEYRNW